MCILILCLYFQFLNFVCFLRHQTMDKVQKHNSFNTNTPSSESYRDSRHPHTILILPSHRCLGLPSDFFLSILKCMLRFPPITVSLIFTCFLVLDPNRPFRSFVLDTLNLCSSKFHTHTKQQARLYLCIDYGESTNFRVSNLNRKLLSDYNET
jgi:hypothetical protein